jgi:hypothetical protein
VGWRREVAAAPNVVTRAVPAGDPARLAATLYAALRELDELGVRFILCDEPARHGIGAAVAERLGRAASLVFEGGAGGPTPAAGTRPD